MTLKLGRLPRCKGFPIAHSLIIRRSLPSVKGKNGESGNYLSVRENTQQNCLDNLVSPGYLVR
jgi:hypothetical protein